MQFNDMCFYKIVCNDTSITDCYVGTTSNFQRRNNEHRQKCHNPNSGSYNFRLYKFIRDHGGWPNWSMILLDHVSHVDVNEARKMERTYVTQLCSTLNTQIPATTPLESRSNYAKKNAAKINEWRKTKVACACGGKYTLEHKASHEKTKLHIMSLDTA